MMREIMDDVALLSTLGVAFLLGMRHALDADHVAAVATFTGRQAGLGRALRDGLSWGAGHAATVGVVGGFLVVLRLNVPPWLGLVFEILVGLMLIGLGCMALVAALRYRLHAHEHEHDGVVHSHLHFHPVPHQGEAPHRHPHPFRPALRPFLVGGLHGLAGSGAVVILILTTIPTVLVGCLYLGVFGIGSMVGMLLVSLLLGAPLALTRRRGLWLQRGLHVAAGLASLLIGLALVVRIVSGGPSS
jgi:ABC-type nickel/cobalt efflux system permease component RcnA